ncbi:TPA: ABC transporter ATP-binding protein [Candidatus Dependentiae bacterium]|nr:MAG: Daunorubicin resistance ABC transporter ATPase subunit [candidate division TM6 bacterium GW2011_GWF2_43_87]HBL98815.1 ABC transporter ATP-binding protein [Candidatus Dependentiae bacterium]
MIQPFLRLEKIYKTFSTSDYRQKTALGGVSADIFPGEIFGLLGVNGAGKTTLSSIIATLAAPTSGSIQFNRAGEFVSIYNDLMAYRQLVGFCPQKPNLTDALSVYYNLFFAGRYYGLTADDAKARAHELVERFALTEFKNQTPAELSGGYRQRVMLARALMHRPGLLILDEPTVGLDPHIRVQLWDEIKALKKDGVAVLLTTHYLEEAEALCDRVCILHDGIVRLIDTPAALKVSYQKERLEEVFLALMQIKNSVNEGI